MSGRIGKSLRQRKIANRAGKDLCGLFVHSYQVVNRSQQEIKDRARTETHRCNPQFKSFPQGRSQSCHPLLSTSSSTIAPIFFFPLPLVTLTCASGQHTRLHVCRPQFLKFLQSLLHKNSASSPTSSRARSKHGTSRVVPPQRHGIVIDTRQDGHGPRWHGAAQGWSQNGCVEEHGAPQVGIASVQERRIGPRRSTCLLPQGQVMMREGSRGQVVLERGCGWQLSLQVCFPHEYDLKGTLPSANVVGGGEGKGAHRSQIFWQANRPTH